MNKKQSLLEHAHHRGDEAHLLREIVRTNQMLMTGFTRAVGMPSSQFALMRLLASAERDVGIMDLARQLGVNAASVARQVKVMEAEGYVRRYADERDARRNFVALTQSGREFFIIIHKRTHELESAFVARVSEGEIAVATKVLQALRGFLEELY